MEKLNEHFRGVVYNLLSENEHIDAASECRSIAVEFAEWCSQNGYESDGSNWVTYNVPKTQKEITKTTQELFDLFLTHKFGK